MSRPYDLIDEEALRRLPPSVGNTLLRHALAERRPPFHRQVFVNRTLRMEKIRFVGFDLDWTLADYDLEAMAQLTFELARGRLVERLGYPRCVLAAQYRPGFARRGLMLDTEAGVVLKMSRHRYVGRAYHGRHFLGGRERADRYRREPIQPSSDRFYHVDTLFELPEVNLFAELVEMCRRGDEGLPDTRQIFGDVRGTIDSLHADGTLKRRVLADLPRFLPRDPELILALRRMAHGGRRLLLITNSEWYYTNALCSYLFDHSVPGDDTWRAIFDLVIVDAAKPKFFRKTQPFILLDEAGSPLGSHDVPDWGNVYSGGSREGLMQRLDVLGEQVLYVGDHIYSDVLSSKRNSTWRTALIVRELEDEQKIQREFTTQLRNIGVLRAELADLGLRMDDVDDVLSLYRSLSQRSGGKADDGAVERLEAYLKDLRQEHRAMRQHARRLQQRISEAFNPYWGSVFKQGANKSFYGNQVDDFACIYTARVSNFANYGTNHYFRVLRDAMMHEMGV